MVSSFQGLTIASTALAAQRRSLEVAGHNVANANTPGYSRQRVDTASIAGGSSMIHTGNAVYGGGVRVSGQHRVVDQFLIARSNVEHAALGRATQLQETYARIESAYDEPGEHGLGAQMEAFWDAWSAVAQTPEDLAARAGLLQRASAVTDTLHQLTRTFDLMQGDVLQRAGATVQQVNGLATQIADLNGAIMGAEDAGVPANDLLDRRDELVRALSGAIGVSTRTDDRGMMTVTVGGSTLVSGTRASTLSLDATDPSNAVLRVAGTAATVPASGGHLEGLLHAATVIIPGQQAAMDGVAVQLRDAVNAQHGQGRTLADPPDPGDFFAGTGARDIRIHPDLAGRPERIAAAGPDEGRFGGGNALALAAIAERVDGPDAGYRAVLSQLGVSAQTANRQHDLQQRLTTDIDQQRDAVAGVSLDEEMAGMIAYQQAYQAAARFMTAVDEMLKTLISGTGLVGR